MLPGTTLPVSNVTFNELTSRWGKLQWFRALCDPKGLVPCCYNNVCTSRPKEDCKCPYCYDMRQPLHAELATWVPNDPTCKMTRFDTVEDTCRLLQNMTIFMFGDSLVRHIYIALLNILRQGTAHGVLKKTASPASVTRCDADFVHLGRCMGDIDADTWECNNTVRLLFREHSYIVQTNLTLKFVAELIGRPNSVVFVGNGIHDDYNYPEAANKVLLPLIRNLSSSPWPKLVWSAVHAPGLLKTPRVPSQSRESVVIYNKQLRSILEAHHVPVFDTFQLTDGVESFDGVHYGRGVNGVKAQILLNYLLQLRSNGEFPLERTPNLRPEIKIS
ncbi:unnamed protein product [Candidula unifasciata]|uniref:Uncharacterized protein n=1 Tax=Candidula unifasciata TaxID=100452 RepID=A0A8S3YVJ7_9EUPU|nr:unnamed protein product [Candidula unifasciata]